MPDVFVPMDTTRASNFFIACNRKATQMRYASHIFDRYTARLSAIESYPEMDSFLSSLNIPAFSRQINHQILRNQAGHILTHLTNESNAFLFAGTCSTKKDSPPMMAAVRRRDYRFTKETSSSRGDLARSVESSFSMRATCPSGDVTWAHRAVSVK